MGNKIANKIVSYNSKTSVPPRKIEEFSDAVRVPIGKYIPPEKLHETIDEHSLIEEVIMTTD